MTGLSEVSEYWVVNTSTFCFRGLKSFKDIMIRLSPIMKNVTHYHYFYESPSLS